MKITDGFPTIAQLCPVRDLLWRLKTETEVWWRELVPVFDRFRCWNPMKRVINFGRRQPLRIKRQHLCRGQIFGIKSPFPFPILKARCADQQIHNWSAAGECNSARPDYSRS